MEHSIEQIILELYERKIIQFGEFTLTSGKSSPIYIDLRQVISIPNLLNRVIKKLSDKIKQLHGDIILGVPYGGIVYSTLVSKELEMPHAMVRKEVKKHGGKKLIEGVQPENMNCIIVEDTVTSGSSVVRTIKHIQSVCMSSIMKHIVCILDRRPNGYSKITEGYHVHSLFSIYDILETLLSHKKVTSKMYNNVYYYLSKQVDFIGKDFFTKNIECKNPQIIKLYNRICNNDTSVLGLNVSHIRDPVILLKFLKTHGCNFHFLLFESELLDGFTLQHATLLRKIADHYQILLIDNIRCTDNDANIIQQRLCGGTFKRNTWVDAFTCSNFTETLGITLQSINNQNKRNIYVLPVIKNTQQYTQMLSFQDLCIGCFVEKREHWMKYSGIFYFSTFTYDEQNDKKACYKSLQHKLYIDNCDFLVVQSNNPTTISLEIYNYLKNTTKLGIKNKL